LKNNLLVILGSTASGKTRLGAALAAKWDTHIVSADSRQVYRGMDIGTGKDMADYVVDSKTIPAHLIDIREAGGSFHVADFQEEFHRAFEHVSSLNRVPILCGGTGMYIEAVLRHFEFTHVPSDQNLRCALEAKSSEQLHELFQELPSSYQALADTSTQKRLIRAIEIGLYLKDHPMPLAPKTELSPVVFGLNLEAEIRRQKIDQRLEERLQQGLVAEVESLLKSGIAPEKLISYGLEYKFITLYLRQELGYADMVEKLKIAIHQFAKRQMTYFRHMERNGITIHWLDAQQTTQELINQIETKWNQSKSLS
jgi:tRNA dimethylallyltransferase